MKIEFYLRFKTTYGQAVFVTGNLVSLGDNDPSKAFPLQYLNEEFWYGALDVDVYEANTLHYRYVFQTAQGELIPEGERHRSIDLHLAASNLVLIDTWNDESFVENAFYTAPFQGVFNKEKAKAKAKKERNHNAHFQSKSTLVETKRSCLFVRQHGRLWRLEQNSFFTAGQERRLVDIEH